MPIGAALGQRANHRGRQTIPLKVRIPIGQLTLLPQQGKHAGAFTVYLITGGKLGDVSELTQQTQAFEIKPDELQRARSGFFTYNFDLVVNERSERVAIGVLDEVSKTYGLTTLPVIAQ